MSPAATVEPVVPVAPPAPPPPPIPRGTAVLHIGDSFALAGFAQALKPRFVALGARYEVRSETSTFTTTWSSRMDLLIANNQPDLVIINLGANETENTDPSTHAPAVRRIVKAIGDRPCVWVSPPPWHKDTGIIDVMRENSAPCRFFDSSLLVHEPIARQADHIHPSEAGGAVWAKAFWEWLEAERAPAQEGPALLPGPGLEKPKRGPSPWRLKPAPAEEHRVTPKSSDGRPG